MRPRPPESRPGTATRTCPPWRGEVLARRRSGFARAGRCEVLARRRSSPRRSTAQLTRGPRLAWVKKLTQAADRPVYACPAGADCTTQHLLQGKEVPRSPGTFLPEHGVGRRQAGQRGAMADTRRRPGAAVRIREDREPDPGSGKDQLDDLRLRAGEPATPHAEPDTPRAGDPATEPAADPATPDTADLLWAERALADLGAGPHDVTAVIDARGRLLSVSDNCVQLLGYAPV